MRSFSALVLAALPLLAQAGPLKYTRAAAAIDQTVLQFASVLESLESQFYNQSLAKFQDADFQSAGFSSTLAATQQITNILKDENAHLTFLSGGLAALGASAPSGCQFSFDSVLTDVSTMLATARVVENLGVAAYLGAASLISDPQILSAAGSILTVEARHQTILNLMSGTGTAIPQAFDLAFTPSEVLAIAGPFISGCDLGIPANTALSVTNTGAVAVGTSLTFNWQGMPSDTSAFSCQMMIGGNVNTISLPLAQCVVPSLVNGPVAVFITNDTQPLLNNPVKRSASTVVAGPVMTFIDQTPEAVGQLVRPGSSSSPSSQTSDISPAEASAVASSAGTSTPSSSTPGPILTTGMGADGNIMINGWSNLPSSS
ncbi:ferritin-like domain-containing protein [Hysterangium stoloniferum]|nr:ferritin-like domain-containing protein [Hysterangium stoloniferum]